MPFKVFKKQDLQSVISIRENETKLGETVILFETDNWEAELNKTEATFVLIGISEDIGVRANFGTEGTANFWEHALKALLNTQHTDKLKGNDLLIAGAFDFSELMESAHKHSAEQLRNLVELIDDDVAQVIQSISQAGKIPIIIGGGHNNAYPILKGFSKAKQTPLNAINLDAHADYRSIEGRHSGNGFRYAKANGFLKKYSVIGLHENYNSQAMLDEMKSNPEIQFSFYEDIFLHQKTTFTQAVSEAIHFCAGAPTGIELDFDCIENTLSSAMTPCGVTTLQARKFITLCAEQTDVAYLHLPEGAVALSNGVSDFTTAKLAAYLITDFMKGCANRKSVYFDDAVL